MTEENEDSVSLLRKEVHLLYHQEMEIAKIRKDLDGMLTLKEELSEIKRMKEEFMARKEARKKDIRKILMISFSIILIVFSAAALISCTLAPWSDIIGDSDENGTPEIVVPPEKGEGTDPDVPAVPVDPDEKPDTDDNEVAKPDVPTLSPIGDWKSSSVLKKMSFTKDGRYSGLYGRMRMSGTWSSDGTMSPEQHNTLSWKMIEKGRLEITLDGKSFLLIPIEEVPLEN